MQMADFLLGFVGIDIARDDGRHLGLWPWEKEDREASSAAVWLRRNVFGEWTHDKDAQRAEAPPADETPDPAAPAEPSKILAYPAPEPAKPRPRVDRPDSKVEFCERCMGRRYPPEAIGAAGTGSPRDFLTEKERAWPGRWCTCPQARRRPGRQAAAP